MSCPTKPPCHFSLACVVRRDRQSDIQQFNSSGARDGTQHNPHSFPILTARAILKRESLVAGRVIYTATLVTQERNREKSMSLTIARYQRAPEAVEAEIASRQPVRTTA